MSSEGDQSDQGPAPGPEVSPVLARRRFLSRMWVGGTGLAALAGVWTSWDLLRPLPASGFGGVVRAIGPEAVPEQGVVEVPAARAYLTRIDETIVAISRKCTHLGCRVPFCAASGRFECPCHGSVFNRAGDYLAGPAPRGMDRYPVSVGEDGLLRIDTSQTVEGLKPGEFSIDDTEAGGFGCATEEH